MKNFIGFDGIPLKLDTRIFAVILSLPLSKEEIKEEAKESFLNNEIDEIDYNRINWYIENNK
jgi:hypothetical protein